ncbi:MAG: hypothetical protein ABH950_04920 [Candidatus Altiarchaeota archaeon]
MAKVIRKPTGASGRTLSFNPLDDIELWKTYVSSKPAQVDPGDRTWEEERRDFHVQTVAELKRLTPMHDRSKTHIRRWSNRLENGEELLEDDRIAVEALGFALAAKNLCGQFKQHHGMVRKILDYRWSGLEKTQGILERFQTDVHIPKQEQYVFAKSHLEDAITELEKAKIDLIPEDKVTDIRLSEKDTQRYMRQIENHQKKDLAFLQLDTIWVMEKIQRENPERITPLSATYIDFAQEFVDSWRQEGIQPKDRVPPLMQMIERIMVSQTGRRDYKVPLHYRKNVPLPKVKKTYDGRAKISAITEKLLSQVLPEEKVYLASPEQIRRFKQQAFEGGLQGDELKESVKKRFLGSEKGRLTPAKTVIEYVEAILGPWKPSS